jgi:SP family general alpha glucoside:H+ symporter-like MFS transporter
MLTDTKVVARADNFDMHDPATIELLQRAQEADLADANLTIGQALRKYPKAVGWAMALSTALIMEGYDLVTVRPNDSFDID